MMFFFDMGAAVRGYIPPIAFWLYDHGFPNLVAAIIRVKAALSPGFAWAINNGMWVLGTKLDFAHFFWGQNRARVQKMPSFAMTRSAWSSGRTVRPKGPVGAHFSCLSL
jgi:hypothetical protein